MFLLRYWREAVAAIAVAAAIGYCRARDNALEARGRAQERARVADSTLAAVTPELARVDTVLVRDTVTVRRMIARVDTLRDSVLRRLTDTVVVREYITRVDSVIGACTSLLNDCSAFRTLAQTKIAALESKVAATTITVSRSCVAPSVLWGVVGAGAGYLARTFTSR